MDIDKSRLMRRAWHLFRTQLGGPGCVYRSKPRLAMSIALREAWAEEKAIAAAAALPPAVLAERIEATRAAHRHRVMYGTTRRAAHEAAAMVAELRTLEAAAGLAA